MEIEPLQAYIACAILRKSSSSHCNSILIGFHLKWVNGDLGTLEEGEASKQDGGHRSRTTKEWPTIEPQRHQEQIFFPTWDIIFIVSSAFSLFVDPLICYIPVIVEKDTCYFWDKRLMWTILAFRSIGDLFYAMDIVVFLKRFRAKRSAKSSAGASSTKTIDDHHVTTLHDFIHKKSVSHLAILPRIWVALPFQQAILLAAGNFTYFDGTMLIFVIPFQYTQRAYNLYKWLDRRANVRTGIRRLFKAMLDFLPFIIASHLYGSMWYIFAANRKIVCWQEYICKHENICDRGRVLYFFFCGYSCQKNNETISIPRLKLSCSVELPKNMTSFPFDYGIFLSALQSNMTRSRDLPKKVLHCFWWGLRNLSSAGSNLETSFDTGEIIFSVVISISGLVLFLVYLNSRVQASEKIAEHRRLRKTEAEYLVLMEQRPIMRRLCMNSLKKVPILGSIDGNVLKAISEHLKTVIYTEDVYIIREGEPLRKMLFIRRGTALTYTTSKGATSVCKCLEKNDFYGEELLIWALKSASFSELPICTTTLVSESKVEAFSITASRLKSVVAEFWWHFRRELPHSQVEYFAASSIQAAWRRRYAKRHIRHQLAGKNN
ncbi:cyclic nucleotide-gated ion channel 1-like [Pyrus ussuriensis x Pyrus communis]|uniref:Cyclic nucleotide-gated ion channel 1-like n=1 Tax=Pyrus ussuriensis x Pyrus communis TaxID=2448454 RepID=A0A5N5GVS6_9ROSA|nr:cyclic nucleotide-gated ion channel 1-like [Pyrus ussuriensis x Pyrus communis]